MAAYRYVGRGVSHIISPVPMSLNQFGQKIELDPAVAAALGNPLIVSEQEFERLSTPDVQAENIAWRAPVESQTGQE